MTVPPPEKLPPPATSVWGQSLFAAGAIVAGLALGRRGNLGLAAGVAAAAGIRLLAGRQAGPVSIPTADVGPNQPDVRKSGGQEPLLEESPAQDLPSEAELAAEMEKLEAALREASRAMELSEWPDSNLAESGENFLLLDDESTQEEVRVPTPDPSSEEPSGEDAGPVASTVDEFLFPLGPLIWEEGTHVASQSPSLGDTVWYQPAETQAPAEWMVQESQKSLFIELGEDQEEEAATVADEMELDNEKPIFPDAVEFPVAEDTVLPTEAEVELPAETGLTGSNHEAEAELNLLEPPEVLEPEAVASAPDDQGEEPTENPTAELEVMDVTLPSAPAATSMDAPMISQALGLPAFVAARQGSAEVVPRPNLFHGIPEARNQKRGKSGVMVGEGSGFNGLAPQIGATVYTPHNSEGQSPLSIPPWISMPGASIVHRSVEPMAPSSRTTKRKTWRLLVTMLALLVVAVFFAANWWSDGELLKRVREMDWNEHSIQQEPMEPGRKPAAKPAAPRQSNQSSAVAAE